MVDDPGYGFSKELATMVGSIERPKEMAPELLNALLRTTTTAPSIPAFRMFELPSELEEVFALRKDRFQVHVISGLHDAAPGLLSFVALIQPLMGWEVHRAIQAIANGDRPPKWATGMDEDALALVMANLKDEPSELSHEVRMFYPILVELVPDHEDDPGSDRRRSEALLETVRVLCRDNGFHLHSSESGDIPKEVPDEWLSPTTLWLYESMLASVEAKLGKEGPDDPQMLFAKASLLLSRDRAEEALALLDRSIEAEPMMPNFWYAKASALHKLGRIEQADEAEEEALRVQRSLGAPPSRADIYTFLDPFVYDVNDLRPFKDDDDEPRGPDGVPLRCPMCGYDFIMVKEGIEIECNRCAHVGTIEGSALEVRLEAEKDKVSTGEAIRVKVQLRNRTRHRVSFAHEQVELALERADGDTDMWRPSLGYLREKGARTELGPEEEMTLDIDIDDLVWKVYDEEWEEVEPSLPPGKYKLDMFLNVDVGPGSINLSSYTETEAITIEVTDGE